MKRRFFIRAVRDHFTFKEYYWYFEYILSSNGEPSIHRWTIIMADMGEWEQARTNMAAKCRESMVSYLDEISLNPAIQSILRVIEDRFCQLFQLFGKNLIYISSK